MPIEIGLWRLKANGASPMPSSSLDKDARLKEILAKDFAILGLEYS